MSMREYSYALFDVGARHCRARPVAIAARCGGACAWRARGVMHRDAGAPAAPGAVPRQPPPAARRAARRGAALTGRDRRRSSPRRYSAIPGATPERVRSALDGLVADGLIAGELTRQR